MNEKQLSESQKERIEEIKKQWADEICPLMDKWDEEERLLREKNPGAPCILDKHLKETVAIEQKYREMIRLVAEE